MNTEIQDVMGQNFALPYDIDEDELMGELDGMEDELASEFETGGGASYMQVNQGLSATFCPCLCQISAACDALTGAASSWQLGAEVTT